MKKKIPLIQGCQCTSIKILRTGWIRNDRKRNSMGILELENTLSENTEFTK